MSGYTDAASAAAPAQSYRPDSLVALLTQELRGRVHPRAARLVDANASDGQAGMTFVQEAERLMRGHPARGRVLLGGSTPHTAAWPGERIRPPTDMTPDEIIQWTNGSVRRVLAEFTEYGRNTSWVMTIRLDSPIFEDFWLQVTFSASEIVASTQRGASVIYKNAEGRVAPSGNDIYSSLDLETGIVRFDSRGRDTLAAWVEYTLPAEQREKLLARARRPATRSQQASAAWQPGDNARW